MSLRSLSIRGVILAAALLPVAASAQTRQLARGATSVELSDDFTGALTTLGVMAKPIRPGSADGNVVRFPVTAGELDPENAHAEVFHSGGLQLQANDVKVRLLNFTIDTTGAKAVLTGAVIVNGSLVGRLPLFDLSLPSLTLPLDLGQDRVTRLTVPGVAVTLSDAAAGALNQVFNVSAFTGGLNIGTATVDTLAFERWGEERESRD
jgi:hypothetical protein